MKKYFWLVGSALLFLGGIAVYQYVQFYDGKLHVIFCDVGQGDAIVIRTPAQQTILVDGGPDQSVLSCLSNHMPFWDRTIDLMLLTHPHTDHLLGMHYVLDRYTIKRFATEELSNDTHSFEDLLAMVEKKKIPQQTVWAGDQWRIGDVRLRIEAPTKEYVALTSPGGKIGESGEFASLITRVTYDSFSVLLTGDSQSDGVEEVLAVNDSPVTVLQSPHHGSATGLTKSLVETLKPSLAIISVGAKNTYGHPTEKILKLFQDQQVSLHRTDTDGTIELVSDGKQWQVITQ